MQGTELKVTTTAMVGAPQAPVPEHVLDAVRRAVEAVPQIREAHLPEVFIKGMVDPAALVLVVTLDAGADEDRVLSQIDRALHAQLPDDLDLGVWPLAADDASLPAIRSTGCQISPAT
ncbi:MAG: hypothetical protein GC162_01160 [Planctomycetes bacterium]|nr:hypothetical protein [Planctomycetota bacterium]